MENEENWEIGINSSGCPFRCRTKNICAMRRELGEQKCVKEFCPKRTDAEKCNVVDCKEVATYKVTQPARGSPTGSNLHWNVCYEHLISIMETDADATTEGIGKDVWEKHKKGA